MTIFAGKTLTKVQQTAVKDLIATHGITLSKTQMAKLLDDIAKNGIKDPIKYVMKNGQKMIVDGHHRLDAAKRLGMETVPTQQVSIPYAGYKTLDDLEPFYPQDWMK